MIRMQQKGQNVLVQIEYPFVSEIFVERENYIQSSEVQTSEDYQAAASHFKVDWNIKHGSDSCVRSGSDM